MRNRSSHPVLIVVCFLIASCAATEFSFDDGDNQGWTAAGLYEDNSFNPITGSFSDVPAPWFDGQDSPNSPPSTDALGNGDGSIGIGTGGTTFPAGPSGLWAWHLTSPDLSSRSHWQGISGIRADMTGIMSTTPTTVQMTARLYVRVQQPDGTIAYFTDDVLHNVPINVSATAATWQFLSLDMSALGIPAGSTLLNINVRVFGPAAHYDGFVFLDKVLPL